jgi:hypothetical protein
LAYVVEGTVSSDTDGVLGVVRSVEETLFADDSGDTAGGKTSSASSADEKSS